MLAVVVYPSGIKLEFENASNEKTKGICKGSAHTLVWASRDPNKKIAKIYNSVKFICSELVSLYDFEDSKLRLTCDLINHRERIIDKINLSTILSQCTFALC